ncbi:hypothetical protein PF003_g35736 [Phytophthora fragariae]|nr:hypothetical protein PF003_g35736 [Phytophthora fragariae]
MVETEKVYGDKHLFPKAVDKFPAIFKSATRRANIAKAMNWWKKREMYLQSERGATAVSGRREHGRVRVNRKCMTGRCRRPSTWVAWLYPVLLAEFDRLRKAGLKFDAPMLRQVALRQFDVPWAPFNTASVDSQDASLLSKITTRWVQVFMEKHRIVLRAHTGKRQVSPEKQEQIEREVASHLGELKRDFESGMLDENTVENIDETHFVIDFDNGKTLGFVAEKQVKYADVVSGGEGITMVVRISGGASGYIHPPMMISTNANRSYPIRGVADDVNGVCYRTGPKGWMDKRLFREYLQERRALAADSCGRQIVIFLDNFSGHLDESECDDEFHRLNARLRYLPPNATDLCQPADSFVIAKIKDVWSRMWNEKKIELIEDKECQNKARKDGSYSGKLKNPGKKFFLELAAAAVKEVNGKRDKNGINYARKTMMRCGLSLGVDGNWCTTQLFPHLQEIVKKYPAEFEGKVKSAERGGVTSEREGGSREENESAPPTFSAVMNSARNEALV